MLRFLGPLLAVGLVAGCGDHDRTATAPAAPAPAASPAQPASDRDILRIPRDSPQLEEIRTAVVGTAAVPTSELVAPGRIMTDPNRVSRVLPPVNGRVVQVLVRFGDHVEQGQPLLLMDSPDADAAVSTYLQAQAAERQAESALTKARTDFARARDLYAHLAIAERDVLQAQNDLNQARGGLESARASREQARRKLALLGLRPGDFHQTVRVLAPVSGDVLDVNVAPGEYRAAVSFNTDTTSPLMTVADLSTVWFACDAPEAFARFVHVGEPVAITLVALPADKMVGRVTRIGDVLDAQTRTLKVYVELPNPRGELRPEMFGSLRLSGPARPALVVPADAVVQEYGRQVVFLERGPGEFERRQITTGTRIGDLVSVRSGLAPGDRVIVDGAILLRGQ